MAGPDPAQRQVLLDYLATHLPIGQVAEPVEIAKAVAFLASDDSSFMAGADLFVDAARPTFEPSRRAGHPSFVYTPHSTPQAVQDGGRIAWGSGPAGEPPRYTGLDVIIVRDGKIAALYVFLDSPPV